MPPHGEPREVPHGLPALRRRARRGSRWNCTGPRRDCPDPCILSDQPYAPDSLVHYRYGAFVGRRRLSDAGLFVYYIEDPEGNAVEDVRTGQYAPPAWAVSPLPRLRAGPAARREDERPGAARRPLLGTGGDPAHQQGRRLPGHGRHHRRPRGDQRGPAARGGRRVGLRRPRLAARRGTGADQAGRHRARTGAPRRVRARRPPLPRPGGDPRVPLRTWVAEHFRDVGGERYRADALAQAARLVDLVAEAHARGCVLRDFTPATSWSGRTAPCASSTSNSPSSKATTPSRRRWAPPASAPPSAWWAHPSPDRRLLQPRRHRLLRPRGEGPQPAARGAPPGTAGSGSPRGWTPATAPCASPTA